MRTPALLLTQFCDVDKRIRSLRIGGHDCLIKPLELVDFIARVRSLIRRCHGNFAQSTTMLSLGSLSVDRISKRVTRGGRDINLSPIEHRIIEFMMRHAGLRIPACYSRQYGVIVLTPEPVPNRRSNAAAEEKSRTVWNGIDDPRSGAQLYVDRPAELSG